MKNIFLFNTSSIAFKAFSIKAVLTFVCNSLSEKESLKIRKVSLTHNYALKEELVKRSCGLAVTINK